MCRATDSHHRRFAQYIGWTAILSSTWFKVQKLAPDLGHCPNPANFYSTPHRHKHHPPPGGGGKETQVMSNHMQVVGLCPTPHKLFSGKKFDKKPFQQVNFILLCALTFALPKPACADRVKMTTRSAGAGEYLSG
jgi:hypothetical protein